MDAVCRFAAHLLDQSRERGRAATALGLAVPGIVDERAGLARLSANLGWVDVPVAGTVAGQLELPVALGQDVRAGGLAESRLGAARGAANAVFVPIGTGIGAAVLADGRIVTAGGHAGELGHLRVDRDGDPCPCGARGCLETVASAAAIARRYAQRSGRPTDGAADVVRALSDEDPVALQVWQEAVAALAEALAACVTLLGPEVLIVGGGLARSGEVLLAPLREQLEERLTFQRRPRLALAALGDQAGCVGAGLLALEETA
jgi:glucokinase